MTLAQEILRFTPAPATPQTGNLPVTGREESAVCSSCRTRPATMKAYYAELGSSARLLPYCDGCAQTVLPLVVAAGFPLTVLPLEPLPSYDEIKRQLDRYQDAEQPAALLRRTGPRPNRGRWV